MKKYALDVFLESKRRSCKTTGGAKAIYADSHKVQEEAHKLMIHKSNSEYVLGLDEQKHQKELPQYE